MGLLITCLTLPALRPLLLRGLSCWTSVRLPAFSVPDSEPGDLATLAVNREPIRELCEQWCIHVKRVSSEMHPSCPRF